MYFNSNNLTEASAIRQSQKRLKKLSEEQELIKKWRLNDDEPFLYFEKDFAQKEHIVMANWMYIWYRMKNQFLKLYHLDYQKNLGVVIPDVFMVLFDPWEKKEGQNPYRAICIEADKTTSNEFDKIKKYNLQFEHKYFDEYVKITAPHFPKVIIVTPTVSRLKEIQERIQFENKHDIEFEVYLIDKIREECFNEKFKNNVSNFVVCSGQ